MQGECGRHKCLSAIWFVGAVILLCRNYWFGDGRLNLVFHGLVPSTNPPALPPKTQQHLPFFPHLSKNALLTVAMLQ